MGFKDDQKDVYALLTYRWEIKPLETSQTNLMGHIACTQKQCNQILSITITYDLETYISLIVNIRMYKFKGFF